jgi:helicase
MRSTLARWVSDADVLHHVERFDLGAAPQRLRYLADRSDDYYISLVGELFDRLSEPYEDRADWSRLGNAITQAGISLHRQTNRGKLPEELSSASAIYAATAFYAGGYSASAYLTLKASNPSSWSDIYRSCFELIARPQVLESRLVRELIEAVLSGDLDAISSIQLEVGVRESQALEVGPNEWVGWHLFERLLSKFAASNLRVILPQGEDRFWDPLVESLVNRRPPVWDFFPSQIEAIGSGLLFSDLTFSMQMPTGAGKTALTETLLFQYLTANPSQLAVLLVPYRSLAAELRYSLARRLNGMGLATRCVYGGTVPTRDEVRGLEGVRAIVATPEALSGVLSADRSLFERLSLVICDEGHLLDGGARGVGLELLLSRLRGRENGHTRFVFVSAIVPNIEEVNVWLGGSEESVIRSTYRPALTEFALLRPSGHGANANVGLELHPEAGERARFMVDGFLSRSDFQYRNPNTGRLKTYNFATIKAQAIAAARKALAMGPVAVFAANKRGKQGAVGLADELVSQLRANLPLPMPMQYVSSSRELHSAIEFFALEFGNDWAGTRVLEVGAVLHHGDIPQEAREVAEDLLRREVVHMAICTNTLAEGVNLPIRTLVLYSVQRRSSLGVPTSLLARDIKNLAGRAGRAGAATRGLVICANPNQWEIIRPVAEQRPGERVEGALLALMGRLRRALAQQSLTLTNPILENTSELYSLIDGVDATLMDLASEEMGDEELIRMAGELSSETFAAQQADFETQALIREVFQLRAERVAGVRESGRLGWVRETGTRLRMLDSVGSQLLPMRPRWDDIESPTDPGLLDVLLSWAWELPEIQIALSDAYRDEVPDRDTFRPVVAGWLAGQSLLELAVQAGLDMDSMLGVHARVLSYALQNAIEQGVGLLRKYVEDTGQELSAAIVDFPEHLKFGVPSKAGRVLAAGGVRHRRAAVALGRSPAMRGVSEDEHEVFLAAEVALGDRERWLPRLGQLVYEHSLLDVASARGADG